MRWLVGLLMTGLVLLILGIAVVATAPRPPATSAPAAHAFDASQLAVDSQMTQFMAVQSQMGNDGMLERSSDPVYLTALEAYSHQIDRMLGRTP